MERSGRKSDSESKADRIAAGSAVEETAGPLRLERFLPYRFSILAKRLSDNLAGEYADRFGLTIPEWRVMAVLGRDQELSASGVCDRTLMDKVTVSRAVARLVQQGRVASQVDAEDRRRANLSLTAKGRKVYREIVPLARTYEARLLEGLSPREQQSLDRLLSKLAERIASIEDT